MVGGRIIEVYRQIGRPDTRLWCFDPGNWDECAIYALIGDAHVKVGDDLWWQGSKAYWTPLDRHVTDHTFEKVGNSFDPRPPAKKLTSSS
jgi:hypothetical protein